MRGCVHPSVCMSEKRSAFGLLGSTNGRVSGLFTLKLRCQYCFHDNFVLSTIIPGRFTEKIGWVEVQIFSLYSAGLTLVIRRGRVSTENL